MYNINMENFLFTLNFNTLSVEEKNDFLQKKLKEVIDENNSLKERLKNYTNPDRKKKYYQQHKEEILQKHKDISPEKRAEYNKRAYQKRKEMISILLMIGKKF
jgi:hypothetical protein